LSLEIVSPDMTKRNYINLGPHPPRLWPEDEDLLHRLWLEMAQSQPHQVPHHRDIVRVALRRLERDWHSGRHEEIVGEVGESRSSTTPAN
jgi:hypothetical protein